MTKHSLLRILMLLALLSAPLVAQKFYPDDPLSAEPPPFATESANYRGLNWLYETVINSFTDPGERHPSNGPKTRT